MEKVKISKQFFKNTLHIAWPSIVESVFVNLATIVDSLMVSQLGSAAVSAIGLSTQPRLISLAIFTGINTAIAALVARRYGEGDKKKANEILHTATLVVIAFSIVMMALRFFLSPYYIRLMGSNEKTHDTAVLYDRVVLAGFLFNTLQLVFNSAQRGAQKTRITMVTHLVSSTVNVIGNYLLIEGHLGFPAWGVFGAAFATTLGSFVAFLISVLNMMRKDGFISFHYIIREKIRPSMDAFRRIFKIAISVFIEQLLLRVGFVISSMVAARQGTGPHAAHLVASNLLTLSFGFGEGLNLAAIALVGRSLGEKDPDKAKAYAKTTRILSYIFYAFLVIFYLTMSKTIFKWYFPKEEDFDLIQVAVNLSYLAIPIVFGQMQQVILGGCLRSAGDVKYTTFVSIVCTSFLRSTCCILFAVVLKMGIYGVWLSTLADQLLRVILFSIRFYKGKWVNIKI